jgi:DnaJ-class molecular chaperone
MARQMTTTKKQQNKIELVVPCPVCNGTGQRFVRDDDVDDCLRCNGSGEINVSNK